MTPLDLFSIRAGSGLIPPLIPFSNIPIYGYYVNDVWTPVLLSANEDYETKTDSSVTNLQYAHGQTFPHTENPLLDAWGDGAQSWGARWLTTTSGPGRTVTFDGVTVDGRHKGFTGREDWGDSSFNGSYGDLYGFDFLYGWPLDNPLTTDAPTNSDFPRSKLYNVALTAYSNTTLRLSQTDAYGDVTRGVIWTSGSGVTIFAIVIPGGDAEALYIARKVVDQRSRTQTIKSYSNVITGLHLYLWRNSVDPPPIQHIFVANGNGWYQPSERGETPISVVTTNIPPDPNAVDVLCFNKKEHGLASSPGGSYAGLFDVDYRYPFYDRGMYTFTSYGGRYIMSEQEDGPRKNPSSVGGNRFVGWA